MTLILDYDIISKETKTNNRAVGGDMLLRQIKYFCDCRGRQFYGGGGEVFYIAIGNFTADTIS